MLGLFKLDEADSDSLSAKIIKKNFKRKVVFEQKSAFKVCNIMLRDLIETFSVPNNEYLLTQDRFQSFTHFEGVTITTRFTPEV